MMSRFSAGQTGGRRCAIAALAAIIVAATTTASTAQVNDRLISIARARSIGLERSWFAQARVNPFHSKVVNWALSGNELFLVTNAGAIHALDANTGQTLWINNVGNPDYPSLGPGTNEQFVALLNGSTLYLLDRATGRVVNERRLGGSPGGGPAITREYVFVPLITGRVEGFPLAKESNRRRWSYQSLGRISVRPRATPENIVWVTSRGYMYVGRANNPGIRYRLETTSGFAAQPAYQAPLIYAVSLAGELFAVQERTGALRWRYMTGFSTDRAPAVVGDRIYVTSNEPVLHAVDADSGIGQWVAPGITQFVAATKAHVYGIDRYGMLYALDLATGRVLNRIATGGVLDALMNDQTDRLYVISESGLVQCLHEIGADEPTYYVQPPSAADGEMAAGEPAGDSGARPPTTEPAAQPRDAGDRFAPMPGVDADAENPFGPPAAGEADEADPPADEDPLGADDNPFAF